MPILSYDTVEQGQPQQWLYVLHGIFGSGRNWASIARRFVRERPDWGARLIDLRQHGSSKGFAAPHTIEAAANDLHALAQSLGESPAAVLGHSFGGKVALMYCRQHASEALKQVWVVDSTPDAKVPDGSAWTMLQLLRRLPREFASRQELIDVLTTARIPHGTAQWMATNLEQQGSVYRWRFDLDALEALLNDFFNVDLWDVIEHPPANVHVHLIKARESSLLSGASLARAEAAASNGRTHVHHVDGGHWVNADNPDALHELLTANL